VCARTDAAYVAAAAFGLARLAQADHRTQDALAALDLVPATSRAYVEARRRRASVLAADGGLPSLAAALDSIRGITLDPVDRAEFTVGVLRSALGQVIGAPGSGGTVARGVVTGGTLAGGKAGGSKAPGGKAAAAPLMINGQPGTEASLRGQLETALRQLAGLTDDPQERIAHVDEANAVRAWTLR